MSRKDCYSVVLNLWGARGGNLHLREKNQADFPFKCARSQAFVWSTSDCLQTSWGHQVGFSLQQKIVMLFFLCVSFLLSFLLSLPSFFLFLSLSWFVWFNTIYSPKNYRGMSYIWTELLGKFFVMHYQYLLPLLMIAYSKNTAFTL